MTRQFISFEHARPDLKRYYKPELNDGKLMSEISTGHSKKIAMLCDICKKRKIKTSVTIVTFLTDPFLVHIVNQLASILLNWLNNGIIRKTRNCHLILSVQNQTESFGGSVQKVMNGQQLCTAGRREN
ncbi:hypothetical protein ACQJ0K_10420 [Priestia megaterium]